ncbi:(2Fe-2S)-binding protein [Actinoallomurus iriomotensis]|uniref:(2Fe-2S)-binding protein n=1 Tax=Actinoallomurus iriomotensis TaxID=478107 RepID=A0A9W6RMZ1_9ACTN|nr:(2Fe-2S)-binding protein [Actinoallomurus iriomotensis]GLY79226.1 (2Fe-2S)-binding protein [Actinoallomurus iriomotensis]
MKAETREVTISVNGQRMTRRTEVRTLLSDFLRHDLGLTGTHVGCEHGVCGACTVLVDGVPMRSCLALAVQADGRAVETVEGLAPEGELSEMQQAMRDEHGLQCGFCTPGILMSMLAAERAGVSCAEACGDVLGGHVCRCTGYQGIRAAVRRRWATLPAARGEETPA